MIRDSDKNTKTRKEALGSCFRAFVADPTGLRRGGLMVLFVLCAPRLASACPVCFGQNDSPLANAMNLGILAMLIVVAGVLTAFASFFIYLMRRAKLAARQQQQSEGIAR